MSMNFADVMKKMNSRAVLDADESPLFERELAYVQVRALEEKLAPLDYAKFIPVSSEMPQGATNFVWRSYKNFGLAKMWSDYGTDIPRVDIGGTEYSVTVKEIVSSFAYNIFEVRRAIYGNLPLEQRKASAARTAIERKIDNLAWNGDSVYNIKGFIKYTGTTEYTVPATGTGTTKTWSTKTADQILTDLNGIKNAVYIGTNGIEEINTIIIPMAQMDLIKNMQKSAASDTTVYEFFTRNNPGITIETTRRVDGAGTGGIDMMIGYKKSPEVLRFELPLAYEQFPPQLSGVEYTVVAHASVVGCIVYYPLAISWCEGI
jgi:hypothetical protein